MFSKPFQSSGFSVNYFEVWPYFSPPSHVCVNVYVRMQFKSAISDKVFGMHKLCNLQSSLNILFDIIKFYLKIRIGCVCGTHQFGSSVDQGRFLRTRRRIIGLSTINKFVTCRAYKSPKWSVLHDFYFRYLKKRFSQYILAIIICTSTYFISLYSALQSNSQFCVPSTSVFPILKYPFSFSLEISFN